MMKLFKRSASSPATNRDGQLNDQSLSDTFYSNLSASNTLCKTILSQEKTTREHILSIAGISGDEIDQTLNNNLIRKKALEKYESYEDLTLDNAIWFPRLRTFHSYEGNSSDIDSDSSDEYHDSFSAPFSWETRSQQELMFPPTPNIQRKMSKENKKKKKARMRSTSSETTIDPRIYDTVESLRQKLKANYIEAKKQRDKYLNLTSEDSKNVEKSINGNRAKTVQQQINKNYKVSSKKVQKKNSLKKTSWKDDTPTIRIEEIATEISNREKRRESNTVSQSPLTSTTKENDTTIDKQNNSFYETSSKKYKDLSKSSSEASSEETSKLQSNVEHPLTHKKNPPEKKISVEKSRVQPIQKNKNSYEKKSNDKDRENFNGKENILKKSPEKEVKKVDFNPEKHDSKAESEEGDDLWKNTSDTSGLSNVMDMLSNW